jgi:hypothetical protein
MMKQRAGLGKRVSSIFDGVPLPQAGKELEQAPKRAEPPIVPPQRAADTATMPRQIPTAPSQVPKSAPPVVPQTPKPAPAAVPQTPKAGPAAAPQTPKPAPAAMPQAPRLAPAAAPQAERTTFHQTVQPKSSDSQTLPKKASTTSLPAGEASGDSWQRLIHKLFSSVNGQADARNKKTLVLAGVLLAVLALVVMWTGIFSDSTQNVTTSAAAANAVAGSQLQIDWTPPEPFPVTMRDPMQIGSKTGPDSSASGGSLLVKSIVFDKNNAKASTAVISGQIVHEGQSINGTMIAKINQDSVEFTANGKSWKQQVE